MLAFSPFLMESDKDGLQFWMQVNVSRVFALTALFEAASGNQLSAEINVKPAETEHLATTDASVRNEGEHGMCEIRRARF